MEHKVLPVRFDEKTYNIIRDLAHVHRLSMADIVRTGVDLVLKNTEIILTKRDIAV